MLKIKDNVDLKKIKKFGFVKYYDCYSKRLMFYGNCQMIIKLRSRRILIHYNEFDLFFLKFWNETLFDLIQAGFVEKIEGVDYEQLF